MFCRKCGVKLPDDSIFCTKCGTKVAILENPQSTYSVSDNTSTDNDVVEETKSGIITNTSPNIDSISDDNDRPISQKNSIILKTAIGIMIATVLMIIIIVSVSENSRCEYFMDCSNKKNGNTRYCYSHLCDYSGCTSSKGYNSYYCYSHSCSYSLCYNVVVSGGEYCYTHTCDVDGCFNQIEINSPNCSSHQINMRSRLGTPSLRFSLNSAGGIKFSFSASNISGKTIKYVRFKVHLLNAVGDFIEDTISDKTYVDVEIIGPIKNRDTVRMSNEIIGYCDNLAKINIYDITIIYADGTSETGSYNYYFSN